MPARWREGPLAALLELRFRLAMRRLRGRGGVPELVAKVINYLVIIPAALLFAGMVGAGLYKAARAGRGLQAELPVTAVFFGVWQAWTALALSLQEREGVDLRRFLVYPLPAGRVFTYGMVSSVLGDPFALFWCVLLAGGYAGAALGRPGAWLLPLAATMALFAVALSCYVVLLQEAAGRLLRGKRTREVAIALLYVGLALGLVVLGGLKGHPDPSRLKALLGSLQWIGWPAALAAGAARALFAGEVAAALPWVGGLAAATVLSWWAAFRLTLTAATSGEGAGAGRGSPGGTGWPTGWLPGRLGPLLEREVKHLMRHPLPGVLLLVIPGLAGVVAWQVAPRIPAEAGEVVRALPLFGFALYTHLVTQAFWLNAFGWDRAGARLHFMAPLDLREVLVAKNLASYGLAAALYLACGLLTLALAGAPPAWALLAALALHAGVTPWLYGLGNLVSVLNPRVAARGLQRSGNLPALTALAGMVGFTAVSALFALPVLLALRLDEGWVLPAAWLALGLCGHLAYRAALPRVAGLLGSHREPLLAAVTGDDL